MSADPQRPDPTALPARTGLARAATSEQFSVAEAVGGPRGLVESVLPGVAFVVAYTVTDHLRSSLVIALAAAGVLVLARLAARLSPAPALSGAVGVGVCAFVAARTGDAVDFYGPGLLINIAYGAVFALSTLRWPAVAGQPAGPWPVIGLVVGGLRGEGLAWRTDPVLVRAHRRLTWLWAGLFALRLLVQVPLYEAGAVQALGVARLVMGLPLFALAAWVTWRGLRPVVAVSAAGGPEGPAAAAAPPRSRPR